MQLKISIYGTHNHKPRAHEKDTAIFSVQYDLPLLCTFIIKIAHQDLLHFTVNRYDAQRPYVKQCKLTTCAQALLCDGNDNASDSPDGSANAAYVVSVSCYYYAQTTFVPFSLSFGFFFFYPTSLAFSLIAKLMCSVLHCAPVGKLKSTRRIQKNEYFLLLSLLF